MFVCCTCYRQELCDWDILCNVNHNNKVSMSSLSTLQFILVGSLFSSLCTAYVHDATVLDGGGN